MIGHAVNAGRGIGSLEIRGGGQLPSSRVRGLSRDEAKKLCSTDDFEVSDSCWALV